MRRPSAPPNQPSPSAASTPPFNAPAARRIRAALGMGPEHVAHTMQVSYRLPYVTPDLVTAWERGIAAPSSPELTALAGVLWCTPGELIGRPRTLREHRVARGLPAEDVARAVGLDPERYLRMEDGEDWRGTERQSAALADVLDLALPDFVAVTGREGKLAELLRSAVGTRWQAYVRPVGKVVPLERGQLENSLQRLHQDYQGQMVASLSWGGNSAARQAGDAGRDFLDRIVEHFWTRVQGAGRPGP
ncbi:helix-turn-helix transcriptional regulator [Streptomyces sp. NPDC015220]|uniref:helix-turn-helix transcriptional regulator n=1 Tax=Streptomyces sp. NPDC015220 TaxID=3364947 RepID=UPI0036FBB8C0